MWRVWKRERTRRVGGTEVSRWAASGRSTVSEWRGLASPEPQRGLGSEQTEGKRGSSHKVAMWKSSVGLGLPSKDMSLVAAKAD